MWLTNRVDFTISPKKPRDLCKGPIRASNSIWFRHHLSNHNDEMLEIWGTVALLLALVTPMDLRTCIYQDCFDVFSQNNG